MRKRDVAFDFGSPIGGFAGLALGCACAALAIVFGVGLYLAGQNAVLYTSAQPTLAPAPTATPKHSDARATITSTSKPGELLIVAFDAKQIQGDLLFEPPVLRVGEKEIAPIADSLKAARFTLLDAITAGSAKAELQFAGAPEHGQGALVFNPTGQAASTVNPKIEVEVSW